MACQEKDLIDKLDLPSTNIHLKFYDVSPRSHFLHYLGM